MFTKTRPGRWCLPVILVLLPWANVLSNEPEAKPPAAAPTKLGKLANSMKPGEVKELPTENCNHALFRMWYDWEEDDIKRYGSQKMFTSSAGTTT